MAVKISGTTISLTRGDSLIIKVDIHNPDGTDYTPIEGDSIRFAMKSKYSESTPVLTKDISTDDLLLELDPEDTASLKMPSDYVYDIQLTHADGFVDTFIDRATFKITEEVD